MAMHVFVGLDLSAFVDDDGNRPFSERIEFYGRPYLAKDQRSAIQQQAGLSDKEREERSHEFNVARLADLISRPPKGLPDFPEDTDDLAAALTEYLKERSDVNEIIASRLLEEYLFAVGGRWFFR